MRSAIVFGLEPVFASLTAWFLLGESLGWAGVGGAALDRDRAGGEPVAACQCGRYPASPAREGLARALAAAPMRADMAAAQAGMWSSRLGQHTRTQPGMALYFMQKVALALNPQAQSALNLIAKRGVGSTMSAASRGLPRGRRLAFAHGRNVFFAAIRPAASSPDMRRARGAAVAATKAGVFHNHRHCNLRAPQPARKRYRASGRAGALLRSLAFRYFTSLAPGSRPAPYRPRRQRNRARPPNTAGCPCRLSSQPIRPRLRTISTFSGLVAQGLAWRLGHGAQLARHRDPVTAP